MRSILGVCVTLLFALFGFSASLASAAEPVDVVAVINGQDAAFADQQHPIRLDPANPAQVALTVTNNTAEPVDVAGVDFSGHVVGLSFFAFHTSVGLTVAPGETGTLDFSLELSELESQATGLINGTLTVKNDAGNVVADIATVIDVRGSLISVYGLFGLALALLTVLALVDAALAIARNGLPLNRWRRGMRLLTQVSASGSCWCSRCLRPACGCRPPNAGSWWPRASLSGSSSSDISRRRPNRTMKTTM
ncbi:hypothetical protein FXW78_27460 [Rhodococcus opacus]|nr:hypothetical protein [Rhodococcus opacus]